MPHSVFALEVCLRLGPESMLPAELRQLVLIQPAAATYQDKWTLYRKACDVLLGNMESVTKGCWDYFEDDAKAKSVYKDYTSSLSTGQGARSGPSWQGGADPYRSGSFGFMTFTMAFLLSQSSKTDMQMRARCNIPENALWRRGVFATLIQGVPLLNFASVKSDVLYVIPGDGRWALTEQDLADPRFNYLRPVV